ncbi:MAG: InlB B-repeat-containing protein [Clostridia bacterium]|nr:InlB B-repeat-containing protein [Clostridia bacterium]
MIKRKCVVLCFTLILLSFLFSLSAFAEGETPATGDPSGGTPPAVTPDPGQTEESEYLLTWTVEPEDYGSVEVMYGSMTAMGNTVKTESGTQITMTAKPKTGYLFKEWTSDEFELVDNTVPEITFKMPAQNVELKAVFEKETLYTLNIEQDTANAGGTSYIVSEKDLFRAGETVRVDAIAYDGHVFVEWTETCTTFDLNDAQKNNSRLEFQMPAEDVTLSMAFKPITYYFQIKIQGEGEVEVPDKIPNDSGKYECTVGEEIAISATAGEDYAFINWTGVNGAEFDPYDQSESTLICPASDFTVTANFASSVMELTIASGEGGSVTHEGTIRMGVDTIYNLIAVPEVGYVFSGWECSSEKGKFANADKASTAFTMPDENCTVTAFFQKGGYELTVKASPGGTAHGAQGKYEMGAVIALEATPMEGYVFSRWECVDSDVLTDPEKPKTKLRMPGKDVEVLAVFTLKTSVGEPSSGPRAPEEKGFPWVGLSVVFVLSAVCIVLVVLREKYHLSYRYLIRKWLRLE